MKPFRIETLAIGDELLTGKTADTNTTFVGDRLFAHGLRLERTTLILDDGAEIRRRVTERAAEADALVVFGGLGPTTDDLTAEAAAELMGCELAVDEPSRHRLEAIYGRFRREVTEAALKQARYPAAARVIPNPVGLAPGFIADFGRCRAYFLPGVPREMKAMFESAVLPDLLERSGGGGAIQSHLWRLLGVPESELQTRLLPVQRALPEGAWLGYRTQFPENHLTLYYRGAAGDRELDPVKESIRSVVAPWCYTETKWDLETVVVGELLASQRTAAFAESCTGGLAVQRLTRVPHASQAVWGGVSVYTGEAKESLLGVKVRNESDAVSRETSCRLAEAVRQKSGATFGAAITGFLPPAPEREGEIYFCATDGSRWEEGTVVLLPRERTEAQWGAAGYLLLSLLRLMRRPK